MFFFNADLSKLFRHCPSVRVREEQHQQVMRRQAATMMSKKAGDGATGSTQRLDEPTPAGLVTRQNAADDRAANKTEVAEEQKLRSAILSVQYV